VKGITKMELEVFDGWTIDRRLKQLRKIDANNNDFDGEDKLIFARYKI
jgi:hypothetical protein